MEFKSNTKIKTNVEIIKKWRLRVITTLGVTLISIVVTFWFINHPYTMQYATDLETLITFSLLIHAIFCGILYNAMSDNALAAFGIGFLVLCLSFFAMGIGMFIFTVYLLYRSSRYLKHMEGR